MRLLHMAGANVNCARQLLLRRCFWRRAKAGSMSVRYLLDQGADVNAREH